MARGRDRVLDAGKQREVCALLSAGGRSTDRRPIWIAWLKANGQQLGAVKSCTSQIITGTSQINTRQNPTLFCRLRQSSTTGAAQT